MAVIFHVDVNSAFLSWSAVKRLQEDPDSVDLRTIPSVICGDVETRHGIVTAKSIPAKRYGISTAEPVASALRKCPQLVLEKSDFKTYKAYSRAFIKILHTYADQVEQVSIDEAFLDMSSLDRKDILPTAHRLKDEIRDALGFTVNVGISVNRVLAKTASDFTKPDKVHTLWPEEIEEKYWPMDIGDLFGCGKATAGKLRSIGILTIGEAAHTDEAVLRALLGEKAGIYIHESACGRGSDHVNGEREDAKSYSNETTLPGDITADNFEKEAPEVIRQLSYKVAERMQRDGIYAHTFGVSVKTDRFERFSRQMTMPDSSHDEEKLRKTAWDLLCELVTGEKGLFETGCAIRLIGVSAAKLDDGSYRQMDLFEYARRAEAEQQERKAKAEKAAKDEKLSAMLGSIRSRYGTGAVKKGNELNKDDAHK